MPTEARNPKPENILSAPPDFTIQELREPLWKSILDAVSDAISIHSSSSEIVWVNKALSEIYDKSLDELLGVSCREAFHRDLSDCPHEQVLTTGRGIKRASEDREGRVFSLTVEPLFDHQNRVCGFFRILRDVPAASQIQQASPDVERLAMLGKVLMGVSHDVGTPLNVISGYTEFLLMRTNPESPGHKELTSILNQTRRIVAILSGALDLARPPEGRRDAVEIKALLDSALDLVGHHFRRSDVKAELTCRITQPLVYGETPQLKQVFFSLLLHAGEELGAGGRLELVVDECQHRPGFIEVAFWGKEGGGAGHDFSDAANYLSTGSNTTVSGTGLSVARGLMEEIRAIVTTSGEGKRGVALVIYLPATADSGRNETGTGESARK
ncbi:MAG: histidine kinase dimerization/phospho-acceptor domain-containing protein [Blastocatellia bacterium]